MLTTRHIANANKLVTDNLGLAYAAATSANVPESLIERDDQNQIALLRLTDAVRRHDPARSKFSTWGFAVARKGVWRAAKMIRGQRRRVPSVQADEEPGRERSCRDRGPSIVEAKEVWRKVWRRLNGQERRVLVGRLCEQKDLQVIASEMGLSRERVRQIEQRVYAVGRAVLDPEFFLPSKRAPVTGAMLARRPARWGQLSAGARGAFLRREVCDDDKRDSESDRD